MRYNPDSLLQILHYRKPQPSFMQQQRLPLLSFSHTSPIALESLTASLIESGKLNRKINFPDTLCVHTSFAVIIRTIVPAIMWFGRLHTSRFKNRFVLLGFNKFYHYQKNNLIYTSDATELFVEPDRGREPDWMQRTVRPASRCQTSLRLTCRLIRSPDSGPTVGCRATTATRQPRQSEKGDSKVTATLWQTGLCN